MISMKSLWKFYNFFIENVLNKSLDSSDISKSVQFSSENFRKPRKSDAFAEKQLL